MVVASLSGITIITTRGAFAVAVAVVGLVGAFGNSSAMAFLFRDDWSSRCAAFNNSFLLPFVAQRLLRRRLFVLFRVLCSFETPPLLPLVPPSRRGSVGTALVASSAARRLASSLTFEAA